MMAKSLRPTARRRSAARLAAVQALYDAEMTGASVEAVLADFIDHGLGSRTLLDGGDQEETEVVLTEPDPLLFAAILRGVTLRRDQLDAMVGGALTGEWTVDRLEAVLRAILRAGAYELADRADIPPKVTISEYVDVAGAFYSGPEPGLVNAVLDRIARVVRAGGIGDDAAH
jgi:N utilization substance protein B